MQYGTKHLVDGTVVQAGVPTMEQPRIPMGSTIGMLEVGVVLQTYYADDPSWDDTARSWAKGNVRGLYVDVRIFGRQNTTLYRVPLFQRVHGIHDEDVYLVRAAKQDLGGGSLTTLPGAQAAATPAHQMDGDMVVVGFLGNSPTRPFVFPFGPAHAASKRTLESALGRIRRIRINGTVVEWGPGGDLTLDATGAAKPDLDATGAEVSNAGVGGKITITTKDAAGGVSSIVLDVNGGVEMKDAAGDKVVLAKAAQLIEVAAGLVLKMSAGASFQLTAPTQAVTASASVAVTSPSVLISGAPAAAGGGPMPLVKYPLMAVAMATLMSAVESWLKIYDPAVNSAAPKDFNAATLADWVTLANAWKTALMEWSKPTSTTIVLIGG